MKAALWHRILRVTAVFGMVTALCLPLVTQAAFEDWSGLKNTADDLGYNLEGETDPGVVAGRIIRYAISLVGIIFLIIIVVGYIKMSAAGGNDEAIAEGKQWVKNGIWGIFIVMAAYLIVSLLVFALSGSIFNV